MGRRLSPPLFYTGRDLDFQKVQGTLARQEFDDLFTEEEYEVT
jgi:hypothetical protein